MFSFWETPRSDTLLCVLMRMWFYVCVCKEEIVRPLPPGTIDQLQAVMNENVVQHLMEDLPVMQNRRYNLTIAPPH